MKRRIAINEQYLGYRFRGRFKNVQHLPPDPAHCGWIWVQFSRMRWIGVGWAMAKTCRARNIGRLPTGYQNGVIGRAAQPQWSENRHRQHALIAQARRASYLSGLGPPSRFAIKFHRCKLGGSNIPKIDISGMERRRRRAPRRAMPNSLRRPKKAFLSEGWLGDRAGGHLTHQGNFQPSSILVRKPTH
jgi:hypothetical protein